MSQEREIDGSKRSDLAGAVDGPPHPRVHLHGDFESEALGEDREIIVYVPPGYEEQSERAYPVLYMHDGQNLFDGRTSFLPGRTWQVREHADAAIGTCEGGAGSVEPLIIVGIYNGGDRRLAEYTPERDWQMGGGEADRYGLMLTRELMPWIAERYRVRKERESTGMGGSSLGGLVTLYLGLRHAQHFGKLAVLSPSVWWNHKSILRYVNERAPEIGVKPWIWLDVGEREGVRTLANAEQLNRGLVANGWRPGEDLRFERVKDGTHDETSWAARVRPMLKFLFRAQ
jgi:predicted alpha/beta superfamily hydrolase